MATIIEEGMIVTYAPNWCSAGERKYLHIVKENMVNPTTGEMTRWLIETINMQDMTLNPTEVVDDYMIEPTGFTIKDFAAIEDIKPNKILANLQLKGGIANA